MAKKKPDDEKPKPSAAHTPRAHKAAPHPSKSYTVSCQDGTEATLTLSKAAAGEYPSLEDVQHWFTCHGDKRDGKCVVAGCAVCRVEVKPSE